LNRDHEPTRRAVRRPTRAVCVCALARTDQIVTLMAMVSVAGYVGFRQDSDDHDASTRAALAGAAFIFLVHCFLQCRDTLFVRPHPGVWRVVHGVGMLYLMGVAVLLFHTRAEARRLLAVVFTDMAAPATQAPPEEVILMACAISMTCGV
jgi:Phosphatidyl serine synthase